MNFTPRLSRPLLLVLMLLVSRPTPAGEPPRPPLAPATRPILRAPGWAPANRDRVEAFLLAQGIYGNAYDPQRPPVAVFDWDNTSIFNDIGDATFQYQVRALGLKLDPADLGRILPETLGLDRTPSGAQRDEAMEAYALLHKANLVGADALRVPWERKWAAIQRDDALRRAYAVLCHRLIWFYQTLEAVDGAATAYPWVTRFYAGFGPHEVRTLVERVLADELRDPNRGEACTKVRIDHPDPGQTAMTIKLGLVFTEEVRELMAALRAHGFDVYVVTASFGPVVAAAAARYGVPDDHVIGMRLERRADGAFADRPIPPATYRQGKVDAIRAFAPRDPVFAAGDSDTDVEMLLMPSVQLRLIIDRKRKGDIGRLAAKGRRGDAGYLLQGRADYDADAAKGAWNGTTATAP